MVYIWRAFSGKLWPKWPCLWPWVSRRTGQAAFKLKSWSELRRSAEPAKADGRVSKENPGLNHRWPQCGGVAALRTEAHWILGGVSCPQPWVHQGPQGRMAQDQTSLPLPPAPRLLAEGWRWRDPVRKEKNTLDGEFDELTGYLPKEVEITRKYILMWIISLLIDTCIFSSKTEKKMTWFNRK